MRVRHCSIPSSSSADGGRTDDPNAHSGDLPYALHTRPAFGHRDVMAGPRPATRAELGDLTLEFVRLVEMARDGRQAVPEVIATLRRLIELPISAHDQAD